MNKKYVLGAMALATAVTLATAVPAFAETNNSAKAQGNTNKIENMQRPEGLGRKPAGVMKPFIVGTVSAVSGNTITVLGRTGFGKTITATTTYTVDATNAKVTKNNATSTVSNIIVGDTIAVQGTLTGTNIVATTIRDGVMGGPGMGFGKGGPEKPKATTTPAFAGNGQPVIAGTISAISSSTISITNNSNVTYTVDTTNAKILQGKDTVTISTLKTGDRVVIQGTVNGTSIVASSIIDQTKPANPGNNKENNSHPGFFGGIGQFFMHMFGF